MAETLEQMLERHEGYKPTIYIDSVGVETVGIGHNLHKPLRREAILHILRDDIDDATNECVHNFPWFADLTQPRQWAMINLCFNLGIARLLKFVKFLAAMELGNYDTAAEELKDSLWFKQVGKRGPEIVGLIRGSQDV